jgi:alkylation response protein AidB-like acyl-CoA dehydrogenase
MDFSLTEEQQALKDTARAFAQRELAPLAAGLEAHNEPLPHDMVKRMAAMGFLGINIPEEYGGLGQSNLDALIVLEELAKVSSAVAFPAFEANVGPIHAIRHFAPDVLKQRVVPAVCRGEMIVAVSMSEPEAGTALTDLTTRGIIEGDKVTINGSKRWCSGGGHSDAYLVYTRLSDAPGAKGIGAVLVEKGTPGLSFGEPETLMGFRGAVG